jgi:cardiolipin synthase
VVSQRQLDQLSKRSMLAFVEQQNLILPEQHKSLIDLFINESFSLPFKDSTVEIYTDGYQFFPELLRQIAQARHHIHIDMYIIEDDALGRLISDALIARARCGVEVRVIFDDVGCWSVKNHFFERLREEGIEAVTFLPVRFPSFTSKVNYRNHRKLIVIDGQTGFIGGMNIALRYVSGQWRDTMLQVKGAAVYSLQRAFLIDWYFVDRTLLSDRKYYPQPAALTDEHLISRTKCLFQTVTSSPVSPYPEIMQGYIRLILSARRYIYIETPYFLPNEPVLFALKTAAASGVNVHILVPFKNDSWFVEWAGRSYLREVQEASITVSLYTAGFLHSKLMVCDDTVCTCGSTNVDFRSFENNFEANAFIYGEDAAIRMRNVFLDDITRSIPLRDRSERMHPHFHIKLWESIVRLLSPLM